MRGGDLSNHPAPSVAVRYEEVIRTHDGALNRAAKAYLQNLWRELNVNVHILTTESARRAMAFCVKWGVPYTKVIETNPLEIPLLCLENEYATYYDRDKEVLSNVDARASHVTRTQFFEGLEVA